MEIREVIYLRIHIKDKQDNEERMKLDGKTSIITKEWDGTIRR